MRSWLIAQRPSQQAVGGSHYPAAQKDHHRSTIFPTTEALAKADKSCAESDSPPSNKNGREHRLPIHKCILDRQGQIPIAVLGPLLPNTGKSSRFGEKDDAFKA